MMQYPPKALQYELQIRNVLSFVCLVLAAKQLLRGWRVGERGFILIFQIGPLFQ